MRPAAGDFAVREILLASPRGFCAGVERAVEIVERALEIFGSPVYVRHEIVHNRDVVEGLGKRGVVFVDDLSEVPDGSVVIFSAHGVSRKVAAGGAARDLRVIDATCPIVTKVHREVHRHADEGMEQVLIGHAGHPEVEGTMGQTDGPMHLVSGVRDVEDLRVADPEMVAFVTQTTLSIDDAAGIIEALRRRFPAIKAPPVEDTCYATQNRQRAVKVLCASVDVLFVVGSSNSSNSNRLREVGTSRGVPSYLVNSADEVDPAWLEGAERVGITAGASAPEHLVTWLVRYLRERSPAGGEVNETTVTTERVSFALPV